MTPADTGPNKSQYISVHVQVIILQSYWRRWLAICYVNGLRQDKIKLEEWQKAELLRRQREREEHAKREFDRRMNPRTKEDFNLLYHALEGELIFDSNF